MKLILRRQQQQKHSWFFLVNNWREYTMPVNKVIYGTIGNKCICLNDSMNMPILFCKQEEADARLFLHCKYASAWFREVIIHTTDTDVFVLALGFARSLNCELFIKTGVKGKNNYFDIANRQVKRYLWFPRKWNHDSVNY